MKSLLAGLALSAAFFSAAPASAAAVVTSIQIKNVNGIADQGYLQIAELQAFSGMVNVAPQGTATATCVYIPGGNNAAPSFANDGSLNGTYPSIYHGNDGNGGDVFTLTLAAATSIDRIAIFGRTDCCNFRDIYSFSLFNGSRLVQSGRLDASNGSASATVAAVPEPATWAMMLVGFGAIGGAMRRKSKVNTAVSFA